MSYRWVDHTAELELEIEAETEEGIFTEALRAVRELLADEGGDGPAVRRIELTAPDRGALLVGFLDELVYVAETEGLAGDRVLDIQLSRAGLEAHIAFTRGGARHLIKGATYHRLLFEPAPGGYRATVVLDV